MNNKNFRMIGISLFEEQIVRALLLSDNFYLLKQLNLKFDVVIFTNHNIGNFLASKISELALNRTTVIELQDIQENFLVKVFSFCLKWSDPSTATLRSLHKEKDNHRISTYGYYSRKLFFIICSRSILLKRIFRKLLFNTFKLTNIDQASKVVIPSINVFIVTALSNSESDLPLAIYFKRNSIPVIASMRSWDNLVTKGTLKFQPDLFLSHSEFMTSFAVHTHGIESKSIIQSVTPTYQKHFLPKKKENDTDCLKIAYGCIGPILNPDEMNFIKWLGEISVKCNASITIVQHPKFKHDVNRIYNGNLVFRTFDYLSSTLYDYYDLIAEQDFVLASGTTFALDTMFTGTPLIGLAFEIVEQEYWSSHLRSYDLLPHSRQLFDELGIKKVFSKQELLELLNGTTSYQNLGKGSNSLQYFTGDINLRFDDQILNLLH